MKQSEQPKPHTALDFDPKQDRCIECCDCKDCENEAHNTACHGDHTTDCECTGCRDYEAELCEADHEYRQTSGIK